MPRELEADANAYGEAVRITSERLDRGREVGRASDEEPLFRFADPAPFDDLVWRIERDEHLGRWAHLRLLREFPGCEVGERVRTTETEAAELVREGVAEYAALPVVRPAAEQLRTAWTIHGRTGLSQRP